MSTEPRALKRLEQLPHSQRLEVLGEGLELLGVHVDTLSRGVERLIECDMDQAARVLDVTASEEAAKVLILLDIGRTAERDQRSRQRLLRAFYNHTARGIYLMAHAGSPADLGEIKGYVDDLRQSHYLDGPTGADWVFRNMVDTMREESIYVDYVAYDDGTLAWVSPTRDKMPMIAPHPVCRIVLTMRNVGLLTREGLQVAAEVWNGERLTDSTRWEVFRQHNIEVLTRLRELGRWNGSLASAEVRNLVESWAFPLGSLNLSVSPVNREELREAQRDYYTALEEY